MKLYYVNIRNQDGLHPPLDGKNHADIGAAREECIVIARQAIADNLKSGIPLSDTLNQSFEVKDEGDIAVLKLTFEDALEADIKEKLKNVVWSDRGCAG